MRVIDGKATPVATSEVTPESRALLPSTFGRERMGDLDALELKNTLRTPILAMGTREMVPIEPSMLEPMAPEAAGTYPGVRIEDIASITHDLKSPLATIALEVTVIQETLPSHSSTDVRRSLSRIERNIAFIDYMIHDLLDLASIDARRFEIRRTPTDLAELILAVVERVVATRDRDRIFVELPPRAHLLHVMADAQRIERVICNFIQNALKYAPRTSPIVIRLEDLGARARVSVIDAGPGIPADELANVFDKFNRARDAFSVEGTGLGLFISRKIVEAHGGHIGVDSEVGHGSRFHFELPVPAST